MIQKQDETQKQLAELKQKITEEKNKSDRIRNIAKKYKSQGMLFTYTAVFVLKENE